MQALKKRSLSGDNISKNGSSGSTSDQMQLGDRKIVVPKPRINAITKSEPQALSKITGEWDSLDNFFKICELVIGGRTPSPFGSTMGAHSTAWVAHIDLIRRHMIGFELQEAITYFVELANSELNSPLLKLKNYLGEAHQIKLNGATETLKKTILDLTTDSTAKLDENNYHTVLQHLRTGINTYLTYVNYLPLATVAGGDPSGHGEGVARGALNFFEYAASVKHREHGDIGSDTLDQLKALTDEQFKGEKGYLDNIDTALRDWLKSDLKGDALATYKATIRSTIWGMFAAETPVVFALNSPKKDYSPEEVWAFALQNFLRTVRLAYPYAYEFCDMKNPVLLKADFLNEKLDLKTYFKGDPTKVVELLTSKRNFTGVFQLNKDDQLGEASLNHGAIGPSDITQGGSHLQTTVLINSENKVGDISFQGRTKSPFSGTMGAHTTAWAVHLDAVTRKLVHKSVPEALQKLRYMAIGAFDNHLLAYSGIIDEKHQVALIKGYNHLKNLTDKNFTVLNPGDQLVVLEEFIGAYLNFINVTPMATIAIGGVPGGRSEGQHRKFLQNYEQYGDEVFKEYDPKDWSTVITNHLMGMFDGAGVMQFSPDPHDMPSELSDFVEYDENHFLAKWIDDTENSAENKVEYALQNFVNTIAEAYPNAYKNFYSFLEAKIKYKFNVAVKTVDEYKKSKGIEAGNLKRSKTNWTKKIDLN